MDRRRRFDAARRRRRGAGDCCRRVRERRTGSATGPGTPAPAGELPGPGPLGRPLPGDHGPFTWRSENGNSRMVAGGKHYPIWFVNLIYHNRLYTLTYKWPGLDDHRCMLFPGFFTRQMLNEALRGSRFVGREVLQGTRTAASTTGGSASSSRSAAGQPPPVPDRARRRLRRAGQPVALVAAAPVRRSEPLRPRARRVGDAGQVPARARAGQPAQPVPAAVHAHVAFAM